MRLSFLFLLAILSGCSATRVTDSWTRPGHAQYIKQVLVCAILPPGDHALRKNLEDHLAGDLKALGYNATTTTEKFGGSGIDGLTENEVIEKLKSSKFDALLTVVLLDKKATPVPISRPDPLSQQEEYSRSNFWNYYRFTQDLVGDPGYYLMHTEYYWESNLYEWPAQSLAFTSHSESVDPPGFETLAHGYGRSLVRELKRKGLVTDMKEQKKAF